MSGDSCRREYMRYKPYRRKKERKKKRNGEREMEREKTGEMLTAEAVTMSGSAPSMLVYG